MNAVGFGSRAGSERRRMHVGSRAVRSSAASNQEIEEIET